MGTVCLNCCEELHGGAGHLFHICRVWGSRHGGSAYSQRLVQEMQKKGWRVTLLAERFEDESDQLMTNDGRRGCLPTQSPPTEPDVSDRPPVERVRLEAFFRRELRHWPAKAAESIRLWRGICRARCPVVIVQGDLPRLFYLALQIRVPLVFIRQDGILTCPGNRRFLPRSRSVCSQPMGWRCFVTHHREGCLAALSWPRRLGRLLLRTRDGLLLRRIRHFVVNSSYMVAVHRTSARVIHPPSSAVPEVIGDSERDLNGLVFCGRLEAAKGPAEAVRVLSLLPQPFHLEILGDGPERESLTRQVGEGRLAGRVSFHGWVDPTSRNRILARSGTLLLPSLCDEAFGMAGLEAFALGTPVVAFKVGGVSEWCLPGAGVLVKCGDVLGVARAVQELTQTRARWTSYSRAARRLARLEFPPERFERELEELFETLHAEPRLTPRR